MVDLNSLTPGQFQVLNEIAHDEEMKQLIIDMMNSRELVVQKLLEIGAKKGLEQSTKPFLDHAMDLWESNKHLGSCSEDQLKQRKANLNNVTWTHII